MTSKQVSLADTTITIQLPINGRFEIENEQILPDLIIWIYIAAIVVIGVLVNSITIGSLLRTKYNGKPLIKYLFHCIMNSSC